jgi:hypothetical protein
VSWQTAFAHLGEIGLNNHLLNSLDGIWAAAPPLAILPPLRQAGVATPSDRQLTLVQNHLNYHLHGPHKSWHAHANDLTKGLTQIATKSYAPVKPALFERSRGARLWLAQDDSGDSSDQTTGQQMTNTGTVMGAVGAVVGVVGQALVDVAPVVAEVLSGPYGLAATLIVVGAGAVIGGIVADSSSDACSWPDYRDDDVWDD